MCLYRVLERRETPYDQHVEASVLSVPWRSLCNSLADCAGRLPPPAATMTLYNLSKANLPWRPPRRAFAGGLLYWYYLLRRATNRNALTRKGKAEGTQEDDMDMVVSIHNNMNELTWKKILEWEKIRRCKRCPGFGSGWSLLRLSVPQRVAKQCGDPSGVRVCAVRRVRALSSLVVFHSLFGHCCRLV